MENILLEIVKMSQPKLHRYLNSYLKKKGYTNITQEKGSYLYAEGNIPILLVAHLDTVHRQLPTEVFFDKEQNVVWSPQGIGGDDRAGVYGILQVLNYFKPHVLFLHDEEIGGVGAQLAGITFFPKNVNFMIELDRKGNNEAVFYECGNKEFQEYILSYGFKLDYGSFSDISFLGPMWDIAAVNLSAGYYYPHSTREYININHLNNTVAKVLEILEKNDNSKFYDYQEIIYSRYTWNKSDRGKSELPPLAEGSYKSYNDLTPEEWNEIFGIVEVKDEDLPF